MAGTQGVGYCKLVIEDAKGNTQRDDLFVVSRSGRPDTGNWIHVVNVGRFFVDRVEFVPEEGAAKLRHFIYPVLYLRPAGARRTAKDDEARASLLPRRDAGPRKVIPVEFPRPPDPNALHGNLLPRDLLANLVAVAYRAQASDLDGERRALAAELRGSDERLRDAVIAALDTLAREAKSNAVHLQLYFGGALNSAALDLSEPQSPNESRLVLLKDDAGTWQVDAA
jgi:hypothetical protein